MTTLLNFKRYLSKVDIGKSLNGTKAIERRRQKAVKGWTDAAGWQRLRGGGVGCGRSSADGIYGNGYSMKAALTLCGRFLSEGAQPSLMNNSWRPLAPPSCKV